MEGIFHRLSEKADNGAAVTSRSDFWFFLRFCMNLRRHSFVSGCCLFFQNDCHQLFCLFFLNAFLLSVTMRDAGKCLSSRPELLSFDLLLLLAATTVISIEVASPPSNPLDFH